MSKKVALITERIDTSLGGAERSVVELAETLSDFGLNVDILAANGQANSENIHFLCPQAGKRAGFAAFGEALKKFLTANHYDIIHSVLPFEFADIYQPRGGSYAEAILRNAASYQGSFTVSYKKITAFTNLRRSILLRAEKKLCRDPNGPLIAALSEYVAEQFKQHHGLNKQRIKVIPNGIRIDKRTDEREVHRLRSEIFRQSGPKEADGIVLFLFAANNFRLKGLLPLIKAMQKAIRDNTSALYLAVAGDDKSLRYKSLAKRLKIAGHIVFLGPVTKIQNILSLADVAVLPSFYDPSSRFTLEALAMGKPVITTKFNGATDLFSCDRHGRVIDNPEDANALAQAIGYFSNKEHIQKAAAAIASDNLKEQISLSRAAKQLISIYDEILKKRRRQ